MAPIRGWREALALGSGARLVLSLAGVLLIGSASLVASGVAGARPPHGGPRCPWVSSGAPVAKRVAELLRQLTLANEITLVEGRGNPAKYEFYMPGIPRLCIPALGEEDGPNGVGDGLKGVTELPAGIALAASWDPSLARRYGAVIGAEERAKGAAVNLGPTINIDRDPRWGRTFEAYSEDPFLDARLAVSEISGVQSQGVMAEVKHFAVYNQETNRNLPSDDAVVSQRALNEIYLPAFQAAVQQGDAAAVMCSYATVNGAYACQNRGLETGVLALRWGFSGFVTSDYGALHATSGALDGTDQEQPERTYFGEALLRAVRDGRIPRAALNTMVSRLLGQMFRFRLFNRGPSGSVSAVATSAAHRAVATAVADEGAVLLKNSGDTLPISRAGAGRVVVIGPAASVAPVYGGGGSAAVIPSSTVTPLQGLRAGAGAGTVVSYVQGLPADSALPSVPRADLSPAYFGTSAGHGYAGSLRPPESGTYVLALTNHCGCYAPTYLSLDGRELLANPGTAPSATYSAAVSLVAGHRYRLRIYGGVGSGGNGGGVSSALGWATPALLAPRIAAAVRAARSASRAIVVVSDDTESEAADRPDLSLPSAQNELVAAVERANPHTVVVIDAGAPVAMPWLSGAGAVLDAWYPGQTNGRSLAQLIYGAVDPSGHLPVTFPAGLSQVPAAGADEFPGVNGKVSYAEGIRVGYRWYDSQGLTPLFPFGFGLSYTSFGYSGLTVSPGPGNGTGNVRVAATVTNTGSRSGADVAQVYLTDPAASGEPPLQLVGFERVSLSPGQATRVRFTITPRNTWWWDTEAGGWTQSAGTYTVHVGDSSAVADLPLSGTFTVGSTVGARQVSVSAPAVLDPGVGSVVRVRVSAGGDAVLPTVRVALQLPPGFSARAVGAEVFHDVRPGRALVAAFRVRPPSYAVNSVVTLHATAAFGPDAQREAGVSTTIR